MKDKVLVIDKNPNRTDYSKLLGGMPVDVVYLTEEKVKTLYKKHVTLDMNIIFDYAHVVLVGADALKIFSKSTAISDATGRNVKLKTSKEFEGKEHDGLYAIVNPAMQHFKPEIKPILETSVNAIISLISGKTVSKAPVDYKAITTEEEALAYLDLLQAEKVQAIGLDSETTAFYPRDGYVLGVSISHKTHQGVYIHADALSDLVSFRFQKEVLDNPNVDIFLHNAKFDMKFFTYHFHWQFAKAFREHRLHDTMLLHYVLDERSGTHGLKSLTIKYTDMGNYDEALDDFKKEYCSLHKLKQEDFSYDLIPFDIIWPYAAGDTDATLRLAKKFKPLVDSNPALSSLYYNVMLPGLQFLTTMEDRGVPTDKERLIKCKHALYDKINVLNERLYTRPEVAEFEAKMGKKLNPGSVMQLRTLLFDIAKITPLNKFTGTGAISTDAEVLEKLGETHELPKLLLEIRKATKVLNTYIIKMLDNIDRDGCLRTGFSQHTTTSGRLSSSGKLNLQQLPRDDAMVKACIVAPEGYKIVAVDMETAEMWVAAALSGDKNLQKVFNDMADKSVISADFHSSIAHMVFRPNCLAHELKEMFPALRQPSKAISFGILFGSGPSKVAESINESLFEQHVKTGCPYEPIDKIDAQGYIDTYFNRFPDLKRWIEDSHEQIKQHGFIYSHFGRKRRLRNIRSASRETVGEELRSGFNAIIQGASSDVLLLGAVEAENRIQELGMDASIRMLVHDSIVAIVREDQVDEYTALVIECIQRDRGLNFGGHGVGVESDSEKGGSDDYSCGKFAKQYPELYELKG